MFCLCLLLAGALAQTPVKGVVYVKEEIRILFPGMLEEITMRDVWIGKNMVRTDTEKNGDRVSRIYVPLRQIIYVVNHTRQNYFYILTARDRKNLRAPLHGNSPLGDDGSFQKTSPLVLPTHQHQRISHWECDEYELRYPKNFGIYTTIWATSTDTPLDKSEVKSLWHSALGTTNLPYDVRYILNQILKEMRGMPIRQVSTISQEGMDITIVSTFLEIQWRKYSPAMFEVPEDYEFVSKEELE